MINVELIKDRYLKDELPVRLGGLAANLARIRSTVTHPASQVVVASLIEESKYFIEWTVPEASLETQAELVQLQVQLAQWELKLGANWEDEARRREISEKAAVWSNQILEMSGLMG